MPTQKSDLMGGFAKGLAVIEAFDAAHARLSISEVATLTGLDRASARRCLLTLNALGYADYDGKFFTLTPRVLRLGHSYLNATPLPGLIMPYLERLSAQTGESSSASVLESSEITYIARAAQSRVMSINLNPGSRLPAYCASMGRVLLAALPVAEAEKRLAASDRRAHTPHTKTDIHELLEELVRVSAQGYALVDQELEIGLRSIAVPLIDANGRTRAAINIGAHAARTSIADLVERHLPLMRAAQRALIDVLV